jgi:Mlc titration factor MtfA (ptsG expression regulator)
VQLKGQSISSEDYHVVLHLLDSAETLMIFPWSRASRRRKLLAAPVAPIWEETLVQHVPLYALLPDDLRAKLIEKARIMVAEQRWAGSNGLAVTEEMKIVVASQAVVLLAGDDGYLYDRLTAIQLYPEFIPSRPSRRHDRHHGHSVLLGEAWQYGNVRLSWPAVLDGAEDPEDGENVVIHEFAHHLDGLDGQMGGQPPLTTESLQQKWPLVQREFRALVQEVLHHQPTWLDPYAAEKPEEFFAVVTESFFEEPAGLFENHPELFEVFAELYRVDPRSWFEDRE